MISKVVVLGGTGFLGGVAARHLSGAGLEVLSSGSGDVDLRRPEGLEALKGRTGPEAALLFAAADRPPMAEHAARFLEKEQPGLVVYLSTAAVYGHGATNLAITEVTQPRPDSPYALAKRKGEEAFRRAGFPLLLLRVCHVYGPGDPHSTYGPTRFLAELRERRTITLFGEGEEKRDHLFSEDFGRLLVPLVRGETRGILNLATGVSSTFREIAAALAGLAPFPVEFRRAERTVPLVHQGFDIARLRRAVPGFAFTPLDRGLRESFAAPS